MDITKIKTDKHLNYKTPRGTTGRGKVVKIEQSDTGAWVHIYDKARDKTLKVRPAHLTA